MFALARVCLRLWVGCAVLTCVRGSVSQESKQKILHPLSVLRPKFRVRR